MKRALAAVLVTFIAFGATAADAAWTPGSGGSGTSAGTTLGLPTSVGANPTSSSAIQITWAAPSTGPAPAEYVVRRTAPTTATVCIVSAPTVTCNDTGLTASTTYSYTVEARLGTNWSSGQSGAANATTFNPPTLNVALAVAGSKTAGTAFDITLTATTNGTTTNTAYSGSKTITFSGPSNAPSGTPPTYPANVTFTNGVGTASITLRAAQTVSLGATDGTISGSASVTVVASAATQLNYSSSNFACTSGTVNVGNGGTFTTKVTAYDTFLNPVTGARTVLISRAPANGTLSTNSLSITAANSETTLSVSLTIPTGNPAPMTLTGASAPLTSVSCIVRR